MSITPKPNRWNYNQWAASGAAGAKYVKVAGVGKSTIRDEIFAKLG